MIELRGDSLQAWINDQLVNEATGCEVLAGPVGFQSEGGEIHFRKIEVTPLPAGRPARQSANPPPLIESRTL